MKLSLPESSLHPEYVPPQRKGRRKGIKKEKAQEEVLSYLAAGYTIKSAMAKVDRTVAAYTTWRRETAGFADRVDRIRARQAGFGDEVPLPDFARWRSDYLRVETFPHQLQWVQVLQGQQPQGLHPHMTYLPGRQSRILINTPPDHAKTTTLTVDYAVYRICQDPNVRIIIVSESRDMARKMLVSIKQRLSHPQYDKMHLDFGPQGGFRVGSASWTQDLIYVGNRDSGEKDPTVEVLGVGSQIYGARADLILLDDCITLKTGRTPGQAQKIIQWIDQEVSSRLGPNGQLVVVGTRVSSNDVYAMLLKRDLDRNDAQRVWTYFAQPAVLDYGDQPQDWEVLWPFRWPGEALAARRDEVDATTWNLVYQQQQVAQDSTFPEEAVDACRYRGNVGPLPSEGVRRSGMQGLGVVVGLDPAGSGYTGIVVLGVDRATKMRYVLDVVNHRALTPYGLRQHVRRICERYRPHEWRIERNGLQTMISQDDEIKRIIHSGGGRLVDHHTGRNKWDTDFGVASLAPLFLGALETPPRPGILIPDNGTHKGVKALLDQLITWEPNVKGPTDVLMALWFAELGARKMIETVRSHSHAANRWATEGQLARRRVVNIDDLIQEGAQGVPVFP